MASGQEPAVAFRGLLRLSAARLVAGQMRTRVVRPDRKARGKRGGAAVPILLGQEGIEGLQ